MSNQSVEVRKEGGRLLTFYFCLVTNYSISNRYVLGFPRDGTKKFPCPAVPMSRDKSSSKNSGTNSSVRKSELLAIFFFFQKLYFFPFFACQNPARPASCPGFWPAVPSRGRILNLSRCPFVPGQWRNFVPLSRKVAQSRPVGNPKSFYTIWNIEKRLRKLL